MTEDWKPLSEWLSGLVPKDVDDASQVDLTAGELRCVARQVKEMEEKIGQQKSVIDCMSLKLSPSEDEQKG